MMTAERERERRERERASSTSVAREAQNTQSSSLYVSPTVCTYLPRDTRRLLLVVHRKCALWNLKLPMWVTSSGFLRQFKWQSFKKWAALILLVSVTSLVGAGRQITYHCWAGGHHYKLKKLPPYPHRVPGRFLKAHKP